MQIKSSLHSLLRVTKPIIRMCCIAMMQFAKCYLQGNANSFPVKLHHTESLSDKSTSTCWYLALCLFVSFSQFFIKDKDDAQFAIMQMFSK